ncbi:MAG: glycosyltransferase family 1 protein [Dehalococcoidia bacterium]|nr:glycosyltransferase family 1 protein [Dehalococcoidia bacterium]
MRIGIDYTPALSQRAGIGRYARELVSALLDEGSRHEFILIGPRGSKPPARIPKSVRLVSLPFSQRMSAIIWHRLRLPIPLDSFTGPLDIYHATDYLIPPLRKARGVATVHDLSFLVHPELGADSLVKYLRTALPASLDRASLIVTDSEHSKTDLVKLMGFSEERVEVVYGGVSGDFRPRDDAEELRRVTDKYALHSPYILTLGTIEPRKNHARLVQAYHLLRTEYGINHDLVIGGAKGWLYQRIFETVRSLQLEDHVRFLGFIPDEDLTGLLSLADMFVFPSIYEGFGLPPLEAMACGVPVVSSNTSCLPEVLGEAAVFVDPFSIERIAEGMLSILSNHGLRDELKSRGISRARGFTWNNGAACLLKAYDRLERESDR